MFARKPITLSTLRAVLDNAEVARVGEMAALDRATGQLKRARAGIATLEAWGTFTENLTGDGTKQTLISLFEEVLALEWMNDTVSPVVMPTHRGSPVYMKDGKTVTSDAAGGANALAGIALDIDRGGRVIVSAAETTIAVGGLTLATQAQVDAGASATTAVSPATLAAAKTLAQPVSNPQGAGYALAAADIGAVVFATGAGAQAFTLPDLSAALQAGRTLLLTIQCTGNATAVTITPGAGSQIDNAGVATPFVATVGRTRISLMSKDGLNWYSGA